MRIPRPQGIYSWAHVHGRSLILNSILNLLLSFPVLSCLWMNLPFQILNRLCIISHCFSFSVLCFPTWACWHVVSYHSVGGCGGGVAGHAVHCRMFSSIPGLYALAVRRTFPCHPPTPGCDNHRCLQILPDVLWGAESVSAENHLFFSLPLNPHAYKYSHYHWWLTLCQIKC